MPNLFDDPGETADPRMQALLNRIKERLPRIEEWLAKAGEEDGVYRFYHQSFKVFSLQYQAQLGFELIREIAGEDYKIDLWYRGIVEEGTRYASMTEVPENMNENWLKYGRPILEAFWHTKYFLTMMARYGKELTNAPNLLPSGWAAVLSLFNLR